MYLTTHAAAGLLVGSLISHPVGAFCVGVISHFALDAIPHDSKEDIIENYPFDIDKSNDEYGKRVKYRVIISLLDLALTFVTMYYAYYLVSNANDISLLIPLYAGICGGLLPDIIIVQCFLFETKFLRWYFYAHNRFHFIFGKISINRWISLTYQSSLAAVMIYFSSKLI